MSQPKTTVTLTLKDILSQGVKSAGSGIQNFASGAVSAVQKVDKAFSGLGTAAAALGVSLSLGAATKEIIDLDDRMNALGVQSNSSAEEITKLKQQIYDIASAPDIKLNTGSLTDALDSVIERTGDMAFATSNLKSMAQAIRATGASGEDIGGLYAEFQKMGLSAVDASTAIDTLTLQGKAGAFTLQNLASLGPRTISAYTATGRSGTSALIEMGAALQVIRMGTGSSEQAATAFEAVMRTLTSPDKVSKLQQLGVAVRDQEGNFRSITDIMQDVILNSEGSIDVLGQVFDSEAMRAFNYAIGEYKRTGTVESLRKFNDMLGDGNTIQADAASRASTLKSNITGLTTAFQKFADSNLTKPLEKITSVLNKLSENPDSYKRVFTGIAAGLGAIAAVKIGAGVISFISNWRNIKSGKLSIDAAQSGNGMPVYVTNWGGQAGASPLPSIGASQKTTGETGASGTKARVKTTNGKKTTVTGKTKTSSRSTAKKISKVSKTPTGKAAGTMLGVSKVALGKAAGAGALGAALVAVPQMIGELSEIQSSDMTKKEKGKATGGAIGSAVGSIGGAAAGAAAGAAIGSVVPVVGTALGALAGGLIGYFGGKGGRLIGEKIGEAVVHENALPKELQTTQDKQWEGKTFSGNANMQLDIKISEDRITAIPKITQNNTFMKFNTGSVQEARSY